MSPKVDAERAADARERRGREALSRHHIVGRVIQLWIDEKRDAEIAAVIGKCARTVRRIRKEYQLREYRAARRTT